MEQKGDSSAVLLVEDEVLVRLSVADDLRQAGFTVLEAANADEAGTILDSRADTIGVVVTDIQMPGSMDGAALVRVVRQQHAGIGIIVLSAAHSSVLKTVEADTVLAKPHSPRQLIKEIRQLLAARSSNGSRDSNAGHN
jgi:DNA-binding response OmpR family regulator